MMLLLFPVCGVVWLLRGGRLLVQGGLKLIRMWLLMSKVIVWALVWFSVTLRVRFWCLIRLCFLGFSLRILVKLWLFFLVFVLRLTWVCLLYV
ncbi:hypothetical protein ACOSQ3_023211 [Xanthoceras sorbifolium]